MSPVAQTMKTRPNDLGTTENESKRAKQENGTRRPGTTENEYMSAKH
jgi:hypothetical protein